MKPYAILLSSALLALMMHSYFAMAIPGLSASQVLMQAAACPPGTTPTLSAGGFYCTSASAQTYNVLASPDPSTTSTTGQGFCSFLYPSSSRGLGAGGNGVVSQIYSLSSSGGLLSISVIIILLVLLVMGIVYAIGLGFGIQKLKNFVKTEIYEVIFNLILIAIVVGGASLFAYNAVATVSNIASVSISSIATVHPAPNSIRGIYSAECSSYVESAAGLVGAYSVMFVESKIIPLVGNIKLELAPLYQGIIPEAPGFTLKPFYGINLVAAPIGTMMNLTLLLIGLYLLMIFIMFAIFYIFPVFLYLGILFRSFPWTRAAGGAFLSLFIAFYIVLPALLYPLSGTTFSSINQQIQVPGVQAAQPSSGSSNIIAGAINSVISLIISGLKTVLNSLVFNAGSGAFAYGSSMVSAIFNSISTASPGFLIEAMIEYTAESFVPIFGFVISFLITYDLLEGLSDLLGAPSLQAGKLFQKL